MSRVIAECPHCHKKYKVQPELLGRTTDCKQCKTKFEITAAPDSEDSFGLPDARQYLADQPFDPLAPSRGRDDDPAQTYEREGASQEPGKKVKARDWKKEVKQARMSKPFGPIQRTLLGFGALLVLAGVVINLLHIFGIQIGEGNVGRIIGLVTGLIGAGLVAASLMKFPSSSRVAGGAAALIVFLVFMASIINARKREQPVVEKEVVEEEVSTIAGFNSPWIETYPKWIGFDEMDRIPSVADRWNRHVISGTEFSASFPGEPTSDTGRLRVARKNVRTRELLADVNGFKFSLTSFPFPSPRGKNDKLKLNESEKGIGEIEFAQNTEFDGCIGKEYRITDSSVSTHGRFFLVGEDRIVHIKVEGTSTLVPGVLSGEFLDSLQVRSDGNRDDAEPPEFELSEKQQALTDTISENGRAIESLLSEHIRTGGLMNFPQKYLSISAGKDVGDRRFLVHPGKLPIVGVDLVEVRTKTGSLIAGLSPVYGDEATEQTIMANEGYALAGIDVNAGAWVKGVRFVFMKISPKGFDTSKMYRSKWYGTRSSGAPETIGADGKPIYGLWICRTRVCKSIGLIREDN